jgi:four helix bundle protein
MDLAVEAHKLAATLPAIERFELGSQIRRSSTSVPSNIAEGYAQRGDRVLLRHLRIALGSLAELETQLELAVRFEYFNAEKTASVKSGISRTGQLLHGLRRSAMKSVARTALGWLIVVGTTGATLFFAG